MDTFTTKAEFVKYLNDETVVFHNLTSRFVDPKAWFPLDRNRIVKSRDSSRVWLIVERLITLDSKNLIEIGLDLQLKRFLS